MKGLSAPWRPPRGDASCRRVSLKLVAHVLVEEQVRLPTSNASRILAACDVDPLASGVEVIGGAAVRQVVDRNVNGLHRTTILCANFHGIRSRHDELSPIARYVVINTSFQRLQSVLFPWSLRPQSWSHPL